MEYTKEELKELVYLANPTNKAVTVRYAGTDYEIASDSMLMFARGIANTMLKHNDTLELREVNEVVVADKVEGEEVKEKKVTKKVTKKSTK